MTSRSLLLLYPSLHLRPRPPNSLTSWSVPAIVADLRRILTRPPEKTVIGNNRTTFAVSIKNLVIRIAINIGGFTKWAMLFALSMLAFGFLSGHELPQELSDQSAPSSIDADQKVALRSASFDLPTLNIVFDDLEKEEEEKEEEEDHSCFDRNTNLPSFVKLFFDKATITSCVPRQLQVKLFILYHSWKSFLFV